jgi:DNA polymerase-3 subunit beta
MPFPTVKKFDEASLIINSDILKDGLSKVLHCINPSEIRIAMSGAYIMIDNDRITFVGTNGVKLSESVMTINGDISGKDVILKYDFANTLRSVLDGNSQVLIYIEDRTAYVTCNNVYIVGTLISNEKYPNYKSVLGAYDKIITVPKYDFTDSVMSVSDVLDPEDNYRLSLRFEDNKLTLQNDRVNVEHEFEHTFEHKLDVDVNGSFLFSLLNDMSGEYLDVCFMEGKKSVILKPHDGYGHTSLISTVRRR